jgi:hypothetical protein
MMIGMLSIVGVLGAVIMVVSIDAAAAGDRDARWLYRLGCAIIVAAILALTLAL